MASRSKRSREDDDDFRVCPGYDRKPRGPADDCDGTCTIWAVHSHPERPLAYGAWLCDLQSVRVRAARRVADTAV